MTSYPNYPSEETQHFVQKYSEDISTIRWAGVTGSIILTRWALSQGVGNQVSGRHFPPGNGYISVGERKIIFKNAGWEGIC